jgi:PAS domain S-box-containing protein
MANYSNEKIYATILKTDETRTMSARMMAVTGDMQWKDRYMIAEPQLHEALDSAKRFYSELGAEADSRAIEEAHKNLEILEKNAIDLSSKGPSKAALEILNSTEYSAIKDLFAERLEKYFASVLDQAKADFSESASSANIMVFLIFPGVALFIIGAIAYNQSRSLMRYAINERKFTQDILDTVSDPIFVKDKEHIFRAGNKAFWNLMGGAAEEYLGKSDHDIFPPEEVAIFWERDNWVVNTGITDINEENVTGADGKTMNCITTKAPLMLGDGKKGLVGIIHDISKLKNTEIELERHKTNLEKMVAEQTAIIVQERENIKIARDIAEAASNAKSDFLANISHELRTPLNSIMGMADLMKNTTLNTDQRDMLDAVSDSSENLLDIVNDLLDLSKIESGYCELENIPFNPSQNIRKVFNMLVPAASKKGIMLFHHFSEKKGNYC